MFGCIWCNNIEVINLIHIFREFSTVSDSIYHKKGGIQISINFTIYIDNAWRSEINGKNIVDPTPHI